MRDSEEGSDQSTRERDPGGADRGDHPPSRERSLPGGGRLPEEERGQSERADRTQSRGVVDPVKSRFAGEYDLYDLATWEARSGLDRFAVSVADSLRTIRSRLLITTALVLFLGQIALAGVLVIDQPVLGVLAALSVVPALFVALTLWYWDPTTREPVELIAITFLLSMLFASFAATVNTLVRPGFTVLGGAGVILFYFLVVGPIEETVKWLAIRVRAYNSDAFRTVLDGVVYGAIAGLGFAAIENFIYVVGASVESAQVGGAGGVGSATLTAAARAFVGPGHVVFSAWAGFYLGLAKFNPDNWAPIVVKGLLIAAFIHALYNSLVGVVPAVLAAVGIPPGLAFIGFVLGYQSFWFGLLYRKVLAYRAYYESISPAKLTSGN